MTKFDEGETYASTTASPPPVQISLDDSLEVDYKEAHYIGGGGLISPNTDFSEEVCARCIFLFARVFRCPGLIYPGLSGVISNVSVLVCSNNSSLGRLLQGCE